MAFGNRTTGGKGIQRRSGFNNTAKTDDRPNINNTNTKKVEWVDCLTMYDSWHGSLKIKSVSNRFDSARILLDIAPVFEEKRGDTSEGKMYDYDKSSNISLSLREILIVKEQLAQFKDRKLTRFTLLRNHDKLPHKVLTFSGIDEFYKEGSKEYEKFKDGLVISIDEYNEGIVEGAEPDKTVLFTALPEIFPLTDEEEIMIYPEIEIIENILNSVLMFSSKLDFANSLLSNANNTAVEKKPSGPALSARRIKGGTVTPSEEGNEKTEEGNEESQDEELPPVDDENVGTLLDDDIAF